MGTYKQGDVVYFIENSIAVRECKVVNRSGEFYTVTFASICVGDETAIIRLRGNRLYPTKEAAEQKIREHAKLIHANKSNHGDY